MNTVERLISLASIMLFSSMLLGQPGCLKIDKLVVTFETFNAHNREPYSILEFDSLKIMETIMEVPVIDSIMQLYLKVVNTGNKHELLRFSPKVLCRFYEGDREVFRFYYTSFKRLYSNGVYYSDDFGLLRYLQEKLRVDD